MSPTAKFLYVIAKKDFSNGIMVKNLKKGRLPPDYLSGANVISCAFKSGRTLNVLGPQSGSFSQLLAQGRRVNQRDAMTEEEVGDFQRVREIPRVY